MSTSILYHGFGIRGYRYVRSDYFQGTIVSQLKKTGPRSAAPDAMDTLSPNGAQCNGGSTLC